MLYERIYKIFLLKELIMCFKHYTLILSSFYFYDKLQSSEKHVT